MVYPDTPVSSTNKTDCHDITELLLKVALNTINQNQIPTVVCLTVTLSQIISDTVKPALVTTSINQKLILCDLNSNSLPSALHID